MSGRPSAAFLDRDGTINEKAPEGEYVEGPDEVRMLPGAAAAIARLNAAGVPVIVVTNQRGIALGRMTEADLAAVHSRIVSELAAEGAHVDGWYHCPHGLCECECRKPGTLLFRRAASERSLRLGEAFVVGDSASDVEAGRRIGATTVLIDGAKSKASDISTESTSHGADAVVSSLAEAVEWILARR